MLRFNLLMIAIALLAVAFLRPASSAPYTPPPGETGGGRVIVFLERLQDQDDIRLDVPACTSSCTFYLTAANVCVGERTVFEFHGPQATSMMVLTLLTGLPMPRGISKERHALATEAMAGIYNARWPGLGDWFLDRAAHRYGFFVTKVRGSALSEAFDIPICEGERHDSDIDRNHQGEVSR